MSSSYKLKDFSPKGSHHIFLDANVLIYAFAPLANYKLNVQEQITRFLEVCKSVNTNLYVTSLVLSEVYNVLLKDDFDHWKKLPANAGKTSLKEHFRPTDAFKSSVTAINAVLKNILKLASPFPDDFHLLNKDRVFEMCKYADFNDCYFLEIASRNNWLIFTRDSDIINHPMREVDIITNL